MNFPQKPKLCLGDHLSNPNHQRANSIATKQMFDDHFYSSLTVNVCMKGRLEDAGLHEGRPQR